MSFVIRSFREIRVKSVEINQHIYISNLYGAWLYKTDIPTNRPTDESTETENIHKYQRTIGPDNAHLKPDLGVLGHHEMAFTLNTHTPLLTS